MLFMFSMLFILLLFIVVVMTFLPVRRLSIVLFSYCVFFFLLFLVVVWVLLFIYSSSLSLMSDIVGSCKGVVVP